MAEVIWQAITADEPKLRYLAGADAKALVAHRRLSDEEDHRQADPDDNAWRAWIKDITGVEIPPT